MQDSNIEQETLMWRQSHVNFPSIARR